MKNTTRTAFPVSLLIVGLGLTVNGFSQSLPTAGLVAYYPFNGNANDASGNGLNGTLHGAVLTTNRFGDQNGAYYFDGSSAYISTPFTSSVFTGDFTASIWFNAHDIKNGWPNMLDEENYPFRLQIAGDTCGCSRPGALVSYSSALPSWQVIRDQRTPTNTFCHVVVTKAGTSIKMYLNGVVAVTNQVVNPTTPAGSYLIIGAQYDLVPYSHFHGVIDDIRFYSRALSASEVQQIYAYEGRPLVDLIKAVKPSFSELSVGTNYQLQVSSDMSTWTNQGSPFMATNPAMLYPQYFDVDNWGKLFFRLQALP